MGRKKSNALTTISDMPDGLKRFLINEFKELLKPDVKKLIPVEILMVTEQITEDPVLMMVCCSLFEIGIKLGLSGRQFKDPHWGYRDGYYVFIANEVI